MRTTTILALATCALPSLALPGLAHAGVFKCGVQGAFVYQDRPCAAEQGTQAVLPVEAARAPAAPSAPPAPAGLSPPHALKAPAPAPAAARAAGPLDAAAREDFGRRAFSALAAGNVAAYKMMLCRATLLNYQRPGLERVLDDFSHRIRVDQVELTDVAGRKSQRVYFNATEVADRRSGKREAYSGVYAIEVEQEADGRTCTNGLSVTNRRSAW